MAKAVRARLEGPQKGDRPIGKTNRQQIAAVLSTEDTDRRLVAILVEDGSFHVSVREGQDTIITLAKGHIDKA